MYVHQQYLHHYTTPHIIPKRFTIRYCYAREIKGTGPEDCTINCVTIKH